jgi:hypothetical protein
MSSITEFIFPKGPLNAVADEILAHVDTITDLTGRKLLGEVDLELTLPIIPPSPSKSPVGRLWYDVKAYHSESNGQFWILEQNVPMVLFLYILCNAKDSEGQRANLQRIGSDLQDWVVEWLTIKTDENPYGMSPSTPKFWQFGNQDSTSKLTNQYRTLAGVNGMNTPWYIVPIQFSVKIFPTQWKRMGLTP